MNLFGCLHGAPHEHWSKDDADACDREFDPPPMTKEQKAAHRAAIVRMDPLVEHFRALLEALPADALEARLRLSILAWRLKVDVSSLKGIPDGAPTVTRHHAKEES